MNHYKHRGNYCHVCLMCDGHFLSEMITQSVYSKHKLIFQQEKQVKKTGTQPLGQNGLLDKTDKYS